MPYTELLGWFEYFKQRPHGWQEDQRTYMLLSAQGVKEKPERLFTSFAVMKQNKTDEERLSNSLVNSGLFHRLQSAAASNNIDWEVSIDKTESNTESNSGEETSQGS